MAEEQLPNNPIRFTFPRWANWVVPLIIAGAVAGGPYMLLFIGFGASPTTLAVGYQPEQPIPYSHELHVNQLGIDCRYCHNSVDKASYSALPAAATCMNCHHGIHTESERLKPLHASFQSGLPVEWVKVHDLPDYAFFNHSAHVNKGVSCVSCHGRVDRMGPEGVVQKEPLSMGWCLKCHRNPEQNIRPRDQVFNLMWGENLSKQEIAQIAGLGVEGLEEGGRLTQVQKIQIGTKLKDAHSIKNANQLSDCTACHR
jgi:hypothetical protein